MKKKFAFLVHLRSSYKKDMAHLAKPLGLIPDNFYNAVMGLRPFKPFVWSEVSITPGSTDAEGYIIMLPYTGKQILEQQREMKPLIEDAIKLAHKKGAEIFGLGALTSPATLGGKLVQNNPYMPVTNGNAYTAVITYKRLEALMRQCKKERPTVALVGASGSVGGLVAKLLAEAKLPADYLLVARNQCRLGSLALEMGLLDNEASVEISLDINKVKKADIIVLLTSAADCLLTPNHLKENAVILDVTQPRNTHPSLLNLRPDVEIIDGGLVSVPALNFIQRNIALPKGVSFACLAETMLLAQAGHESGFSIGNPTLEQAHYISGIAKQFSHLGFGLANDYCFGKPVKVTPQFSPAAVEMFPRVGWQVA